jgi:hypothetical protein
MSPKIYEIGWIIGCCEYEFLKTEWHVFASHEEARSYGLRRENELNDGLPAEEKAFEGYYYRYYYAQPVEQLGEYTIALEPRKSGEVS